MPPFIPGLKLTEKTKGEDVMLLLGITRWCSVQLGVVLLSTLHTLLNAIVCCYSLILMVCSDDISVSGLFSHRCSWMAVCDLCCNAQSISCYSSCLVLYRMSIAQL